MYRTSSSQGITGGIKRCPICQASAADHTAMWRAIDLEVLATPMPPEIRHPIRLLCNDCHRESTVRWHVVAQKCPGPGCGSYNTRQVEMPAAVEGQAPVVEEAAVAGGGGGGGGGAGGAGGEGEELGASPQVLAAVTAYLASLEPVQPDTQALVAFLRGLLPPPPPPLPAAGAEGGGEAAAAAGAAAAAAHAAEEAQIHGLMLSMVAAMLAQGLSTEELIETLQDAGYLEGGEGEEEEEEGEDDEDEDEDEGGGGGMEPVD